MFRLARRAATLLISSLASSAIALAQPRDVLDPALRAEVEGLVAEVAASPTTGETVRERSSVLWDWANAYALTGEPIPQDLPIAVARIGADGGTAADFAPWIAAFDGWVRELALKDEQPDALGTVRISHRGPLPARSWQTIEQTWTAGSVGMPVGGGIRVGVDGFNDQGALQTADPAGDNYLSIRASNPRARFVAGPGGAGLSLATRYVASFTLEGAPLLPGDTVTLTYGDRAGGSRGFQLQSWSIDALLMPIYLDLKGEGAFMTPRWAGVEIAGMEEVARVNAVAPSVVEPGERFALAVRSEDRYYNRSSGAIAAYDVLLGGRQVASIPAGDRGLTVVEGLRIDAPGVHRFEVRSRDGAHVTLSNPIWVDADPAFRVFWGDTHGHTQYAEGQGSPDHYFAFARDDARLDFVVLSEHDVWMDDFEWRTMRELSARYREEGRFLPFLGYEWTAPPARGGHHNVFFRRDTDWRVSAQIAPELSRLYRALRRAYRDQDVVVVPHAHAPGDWRQSDPAIERLIEIASTHGTFEFFGNRYLEEGWEVGFIGSTDNHHGHPGYPDTGTTFHTERNGLAAVLAPELTGDALFDAMREIKAYATSGERILLQASLGGAPMGTRVPAGTERRVAVRASGTGPIDSIDVIKNGEVAFHKSYLEAPLGAEPWVRVAFASSSEVAEHRAPREYRVWNGAIEVSGARLVEVRSPDVENRHLERVERSAEDPSRVDVALLTRGRANVVLLRLAGAEPSTEVRIRLDEGRTGPARANAPVLPAESFTVRLGDLAHGPKARTLEMTGTPPAGSAAAPATRGEDSITVDVVDVDAPLDRTLEWTDLGPTGDGDYYYVRVTQLGGGRAWSSPFWVGGTARSVEDTARAVAAADGAGSGGNESATPSTNAPRRVRRPSTHRRPLRIRSGPVGR